MALCLKFIAFEYARLQIVESNLFSVVGADSDVDKTTTIYRRFDELSARNLLFYQAELAGLEEELKQLDNEDRDAKDQTSIAFQRDWSTFVSYANGDGVTAKAKEKEKLELAMKIRDKLEKYHMQLPPYSH